MLRAASKEANGFASVPRKNSARYTCMGRPSEPWPAFCETGVSRTLKPFSAVNPHSYLPPTTTARQRPLPALTGAKALR